MRALGGRFWQRCFGCGVFFGGVDSRGDVFGAVGSGGGFLAMLILAGAYFGRTVFIRGGGRGGVKGRGGGDTQGGLEIGRASCRERV